MPDKILIKTPPGYGINKTIEIFKSEYKKSPLSAYLILPTERLCREARELLLSEGLCVVYNSVVKPDEFAAKIAKIIPGHRLIKEEEAKMLLLEVIKSKSEYAAALSPSKEISLRLVNDIYALIQAVFEQEADYKNVFSSGNLSKNRALISIINEYEEILSFKKMIPPEKIWETSANELKERGFLADEPVIVFSGLFEPQPAKKRFINACASKSRKAFYFLPFSENQRICSDDGEWFNAEKTLNLYTDADYENIFSVKKPENISAKVFAKRYKSLKSEISGCAAEITRLLETGVKPSQIAVASPDLAGTTALIDEVFSDFGLSYSSSATVPFGRSPVLQFIILLLETVAGNFSRETVCELFSSPYISSAAMKPKINPALTDIVAGKAMIENSLFSWENSIKKYIKRENEKLLLPDTPDFRRKEIEGEISDAQYVLKSAIPRLKDLSALNSEDTYKGHINRIISLLKNWEIPFIDDSCGDEICRRDVKDLNRILRLLLDLSGTSEALGAEKVSFSEFARFFSSSAGAMRVSLKNETGRIQILGIQELQDMRFSCVFLVSLVDGTIPEIPSLLPYTNDLEDQAIWPGKRREKVRWGRFYFINALFAGSDRVYLSCHDKAGERQEIPSQFYETASEMLSAQNTDDSNLFESFSSRISETARHLSKGEIYEKFCLPDGISTISLLERINMEGYYRRGLYESVYDGILSEEDDIKKALLERFDEKHAYSPTSLEIYAQCPFRFYLKNVLLMNPQKESGFVLSAADRGELLHRTLYSFYREWKKNHNGSLSKKERDEALSLLKSCALLETESFGVQGPAWDMMIKEILGSTGYGSGILEKFISEEAKLFPTGLVPRYFEAGFGFSGTDTAFTTQPAEVVSKSGKSIFLRGFVDRIDVRKNMNGSCDFVIVDYKTGSHPKYKDIAEGKALQIPLYLRAVEAAKGFHGIGGFYYKLSKREVFRRAELYDTDEEELFSNFPRTKMKDSLFEDAVERSVSFACTYAEKIRNGIFNPAESAKDCSAYCEFKHICRFSEFRILEQENMKNKACGVSSAEDSGGR